MQQTDYLNYMQIESWRLQGSPVIDQKLSESYCYQLGARGVLIASAKGNSKEEAELVAAIVKATKMQSQGGYQSHFSLSDLPDSVTVLISLGECAEHGLLLSELPPHKLIQHNHLHIMLTHSPSAMLKNKSLKAKVWVDLQVAIRALNEG